MKGTTNIVGFAYGTTFAPYEPMLATTRVDSRTSSLAIYATATLVAYFLAQGTSSLIASAFDFRAPPPSPGTSAVAASSQDVDRARDDILTRNAFDHETGSVLHPRAEEEVVPPDDAGEEQPSASGCDISLRVVGLVHDGAHPERSRAAIHAPGVGLGLYRPGMRVLDMTLDSVSVTEVRLTASDNTSCELSLFSGQSGVHMTTTARAASRTDEVPRPAPSRGARQQRDLGVRQIADSRYSLPRHVLLDALGNPGGFLGRTIAVPAQRDGRTLGLTIRGVRRDDPLSQLGVRSGDMLRTINGHSFSDPNEILSAMATLRQAEDLTLHLDRRGQSVTLHYAIE